MDLSSINNLSNKELKRLKKKVSKELSRRKEKNSKIGFKLSKDGRV